MFSGYYLKIRSAWYREKTNLARYTNIEISVRSNKISSTVYICSESLHTVSPTCNGFWGALDAALGAGLVMDDKRFSRGRHIQRVTRFIVDAVEVERAREGNKRTMLRVERCGTPLIRQREERKYVRLEEETIGKISSDC